MHFSQQQHLLCDRIFLFFLGEERENKQHFFFVGVQILSEKKYGKKQTAAAAGTTLMRKM